MCCFLKAEGCTLYGTELIIPVGPALTVLLVALQFVWSAQILAQLICRVNGEFIVHRKGMKESLSEICDRAKHL